MNKSDEFEALSIDKAMIREWINHNKHEFDKDISEDDARVELEKLKSKGCLLYVDCRSCPKFGKCCPI